MSAADHRVDSGARDELHTPHSNLLRVPDNGTSTAKVDSRGEPQQMENLDKGKSRQNTSPLETVQGPTYNKDSGKQDQKRADRSDHFDYRKLFFGPPQPPYQPQKASDSQLAVQTSILPPLATPRHQPLEQSAANMSSAPSSYYGVPATRAGNTTENASPQTETPTEIVSDHRASTFDRMENNVRDSVELDLSALELSFKNFEEVLDHKPTLAWEPLENDQTIPQTDEERKVWVRRLLAAFLNLKGIKDKQGPVFKARWNTEDGQPVGTYYELKDVEATCWTLVDSAERVSRYGSVAITSYDPKTMKKFQKTRDWTFEVRMEHLIDLCAHYKARCDGMLRGNNIELHVAIPRDMQSTAETNRGSNDNRGHYIEAGRQVKKVIADPRTPFPMSKLPPAARTFAGRHQSATPSSLSDGNSEFMTPVASSKTGNATNPGSSTGNKNMEPNGESKVDKPRNSNEHTGLATHLKRKYSGDHGPTRSKTQDVASP